MTLRIRPGIFCLLLASLMLTNKSLADNNWVPLFDAESFRQWRLVGASPADFRLDEGIVTGQPIGTDPENAFLCSPRAYQDFELRFAFRISDPVFNSGVQFRSRVLEDGRIAGPQLEMYLGAPPEQNSFLHRHVIPLLGQLLGRNLRRQHWPTAGIYGENTGEGWLFPGMDDDPEAFAAQGQRLVNVKGWNELRLEAIGPRIRSWQGGELRADFQGEAIADTGLICLQVHGGHFDDPSQYRVEWKNLEIRDYRGLDDE